MTGGHIFRMIEEGKNVKGWWLVGWLFTHRNSKLCRQYGGAITIAAAEDGVGDLQVVGVVGPNVGKLVTVEGIERGVVDGREFD